MKLPPSASDRPPTSVDVARLAGVSQATVSYVLNDAPGVRISEETRAKVRAAADRLGYAPHASARALKTGRSDLVLCPVPDVALGSLFGIWMREMTERLGERGFRLVLLQGDAQAKGVAAARAWAEWRPAAVLVQEDRLTRAAVRQLHAAGTAAVVAIGPEPSALTPTLVFDDAGIGRAAARHLIERGRRRLAAVVPTEPVLRDFGERRLAGVLTEAAEAGGAAGSGLAVERVDLPFDEGAAAAVAARWAVSPDRPDAVFAYNDEYAVLMLRALQDAGLDVPGDVALVGADDLPWAALLRPRISSVRILGEGAAGDTADWIAGLIRDRERSPAVHRALTRVEIVPRESS
ncbi:LacI family DNA-binding transcriptional regulator [Actinomadura rupiterrae]|uniref:LacI family DNA-binding transcriptional regulator n=1 Tax=Actinomadura rupiterrae TaxID=559627 RepID=UPI0020A30189|nr:LacI family DNA-binding transcriptional regulator [Actinomadura rupiterrae]MCP2341616.1 DNA-binding LacI/PurR family transcriptional regulator [Actinomadura rupiterrae]